MPRFTGCILIMQAPEISPKNAKCSKFFILRSYFVIDK